MTTSKATRLTVFDDQQEPEQPALLVAVASSDLVAIDQHFGSAVGFGIYRVSATDFQLQNVTRFEELAQDGNEDKLAGKIACLSGCVAVFCEAAGGSAVRKLVAAGIQPIKLEAGSKVAEVLSWLQGEIAQPTLPWIIKAVNCRPESAADRFEAMEEEGWQG